MKQIITFTLSLILIACTPQVIDSPTATFPPPTQTPIPTPTLHPEFVEIQNLIADSSEDLTLLPNGQIEENGIVIPNLQVDQNGEITILVEDESIVVNSADLTFEDGFHIKGYELENGRWVEAISEALQVAQIDFDKYRYDYSELTFVEDDEGVVVATNKDGRVVYKNGKFHIDFVIEQAVKQDIMPTNVGYDKKVFDGSGQYYVDHREQANREYFHPLQARFRQLFEEQYGFDPFDSKALLSRVMLNPEINAWASTLIINSEDPSSDRYIFYELSDTTIVIVPLI